MLILGIDTSCDDTGIGIVRDGQVIAHVVASQTTLHAQYGGVMPEQASREHLAVIDHVMLQALSQARVALSDITHVAATYGPGLIGALLVGLSYAKGLAWARGIPFIGIHHLEGHIAASTLGANMQDTGLAPPFLCLIASGGHTSLFRVLAWGEYLELGRTRDDAAGEAFDKVARLLELGYPGGPPLSKLAERGNPLAFRFTRPLERQTGFDFSFSGLKTAVATLVQKEPNFNKADLAASFQHAVVDSLCHVSMQAAKATRDDTLVISGGVAANKVLRQRFADTGLRVFFPPPALTTDNGAMIALAAYKRLQAGLITPHDLAQDLAQDATPYAPLASLPTQDKHETLHQGEEGLSSFMPKGHSGL